MGLMKLRPYESMNSTAASGLAMLFMGLGLWQMYAKLYFVTNQVPIHTFLDVFISLVVALGFSLGTMVIVVQSKKLVAPIGFAVLDFLAGAIYFEVWKGNWGGLLISFTSATIILYLGELFVRKHQERLRASTEAQRVREEMEAEIARLRAAYEQENEGLKKAINGQKKQLEALEQMVTARQLELGASTEALQKQKEAIKQLEEALYKKEEAYQRLQSEAKDWQEVYAKEMQRRRRLSKAHS